VSSPINVRSGPIDIIIKLWQELLGRVLTLSVFTYIVVLFTRTKQRYARAHQPTALRSGPNRLLQVLDSYWRSQDSGDFWNKSRPLKKKSWPPLWTLVEVPDVLVLSAHDGFHMETLIIHKLGFNQNYYTFTLILRIKIFMCSKFPWTKFINYKCFVMRLGGLQRHFSNNPEMDDR